MYCWKESTTITTLHIVKSLFRALNLEKKDNDTDNDVDDKKNNGEQGSTSDLYLNIMHAEDMKINYELAQARLQTELNMKKICVAIIIIDTRLSILSRLV